MSTESNINLVGGGGNHDEFEVQTAKFINFLIGGSIPTLPGRHITEFRQHYTSAFKETFLY